MPIQGALRELGIHDVFQLLDLSRKTGRLRVTSALRDNEGTVLFRDGRVVSATIRSNPHPLGAVLMRAGRITEQELEQARAAQQASDTPRLLGEVLVELGIMSQRDLERFIRRQVETVIFELLSWQEGFFSFVETAIDTSKTEGLTSIPTECLLMEGARRLDEWTQIQQRVPHLGVVPVLAEVSADQPAPVLELLPNEWEVLAIIDGARDVRTLAATLGRSEFDVAKIVFGLLTTGVISLFDSGEDIAPPGPRDVAAALAEANDALAADQIDAALTAAASAVAAAPGNADARTVLARALYRSGRDAEGDEELRLALEADALNTSALMEAARAAARRGRLAKAIQYWEQIVAACPDSPVADQARHAAAHASRLVAVLEGADA
jgi:hypothetical protein